MRSGRWDIWTPLPIMSYKTQIKELRLEALPKILRILRQEKILWKIIQIIDMILRRVMTWNARRIAGLAGWYPTGMGQAAQNRTNELHQRTDYRGMDSNTKTIRRERSSRTNSKDNQDNVRSDVWTTMGTTEQYFSANRESNSAAGDKNTEREGTII